MANHPVALDLAGQLGDIDRELPLDSRGWGKIGEDGSHAAELVRSHRGVKNHLLPPAF